LKKKKHDSQNLLEERKYLQKELKQAETVIKCQTRQNQILERIKEKDKELAQIHILKTKQGGNSKLEKEENKNE